MALVETAKEQGPESRFQSFEYATVITRRNFGMNRIRSSPDVVSLNTKRGTESPVNNANKGAVVFGQGGIGDKSSNIWNWPLGNVNVTSEERKFEVALDFKPFLPAEVSAKVLGNELQIQCKSADAKNGKMRELNRCYQLPMNVDPKSAQFEILTDSRQLVVTLLKSLPIKLAVCDYTMDSDEGSDSGQYD